MDNNTLHFALNADRVMEVISQHATELQILTRHYPGFANEVLRLEQISYEVYSLSMEVYERIKHRRPILYEPDKPLPDKFITKDDLP